MYTKIKFSLMAYKFSLSTHTYVAIKCRYSLCFFWHAPPCQCAVDALTIHIIYIYVSIFACMYSNYYYYLLSLLLWLLVFLEIIFGVAGMGQGIESHLLLYDTARNADYYTAKFYSVQNHCILKTDYAFDQRIQDSARTVRLNHIYKHFSSDSTPLYIS